MIPIPEKEVAVYNERLFASVVRTTFGQRRKTLRNTLRGYLENTDYEKLGIDSQLRAEDLAVGEYVCIVNYLNDREG